MHSTQKLSAAKEFTQKTLLFCSTLNDPWIHEEETWSWHQTVLFGTLPHQHISGFHLTWNFLHMQFPGNGSGSSEPLLWLDCISGPSRNKQLVSTSKGYNRENSGLLWCETAVLGAWFPTFQQNVRTHSFSYTVSHPRRPESSTILLLGYYTLVL